LDVAILQVTNDNVDWHPVPLPDITTTTRLEGRSINIVGYSLFNPSSPSSPLSGPSVTVGNITRTIYHTLDTHTIAMIMTNAAVHGGGSGGAVIDSETDELIGMVTSNAKLNKKPGGNNSNNVIIIPEMSFVLPMNVLLPILQAAIQGEGSNVDWRRYDVKDKVVEQIWALKDGGGGFGGAKPPEALSRLMAHLDDDDDGDDEGSGDNTVGRSRL
jgi:S1-C subfamily serine protease